MKKRYINIERNTLDEAAKTFFIKTCGFNLSEKKSIQMYTKAETVLAEMKDTLNIKVVIKQYDSSILDTDKLIVDKTNITCHAFNKIDKENVNGIYFYAMTIGENETKCDSITDELYRDTWATCYLDAGRDKLAKMLSFKNKPYILSDSFGPGFYGMDSLEIKNILKIINDDKIGITLTNSGIIKPQKSCVGVYFIFKAKPDILLNSCKYCVVNGGCQFCNHKKRAEVTIMPQSKIVATEIGTNLLAFLKANGVPVDGYCGGMGTCGKCDVYIKDLLGDRKVLSCQTDITDDMTVYTSQTFENSKEKSSKMIELPFMRANKENIQMDKCYGVAVDIGTTTVVAMLWDLKTQKNIDIIAKRNPQSAYGADVISRINYCSTEENLKTLQTAILSSIDDILDEFCKRQQISRNDIYNMVLAGNSTMYHIALGISPKTLAIAPFKPLQHNSLVIKAKDFFCDINPMGEIYMMPIIAGHVGSDTISVMVASKLKENSENVLIIDIGTNGEIVLAKKTEYMTCSTAAGPAFEGMNIKHGMRGTKGAIERMAIIDDVQLQIIDSDIAMGICGSGLVDAVAELLSARVIDSDGVMLTSLEALKKGIPVKIANRLRQTDDGNEFVLYYSSEKDITLTQKDIRELQLAKGAILAGIHIVMKEMGLKHDDIDKIYLAGVFGNYIDVENACKIGLIPDIKSARTMQMGNLAGVGSSMVLISDEKKQEGEFYAITTKHIELSSHENFAEEFMSCLPLKRF